MHGLILYPKMRMYVVKCGKHKHVDFDLFSDFQSFPNRRNSFPMKELTTFCISTQRGSNSTVRENMILVYVETIKN